METSSGNRLLIVAALAVALVAALFLFRPRSTVAPDASGPSAPRDGAAAELERPEPEEVPRDEGVADRRTVRVTPPTPAAPATDLSAGVYVQLMAPTGEPAAGGSCAFLRRPERMEDALPGRPAELVLAADADGRAVARLDPGAWILEAHAPGLVGRPVHFDLARGEARPILMGLDEAATVCGRVTDRDTGAGIANAWVWCPTRGTSLAVLTDEDGRYRQPHVTAHIAYALRAVAEGYGAETRYVTSPGGHDCAERPFDLELFGGKTVRGSLPGSVDTVRARIEAIGYFPTGNAIRTLNGAVTRAEPDGSFAIEDLRSDIEHEIVVEAPGHARRVLVVPAQQGLVDVGLVDLQREATLSGTVSAVDGTRVADVVVRMAQLDVASRLFDPDPFVVRTGPDGAYRLDGLPAGRWRIDVLGGGSSLAADEVGLVPGHTLRDLVLREAIPRVRGRLVGDDLAGLSLLVDIGTFSRRIPIAADGTFTAHGVPCADNVLLHVQRADATGTWRDLSFVRGTDLVPDQDVLIRLD